MSYMLPHLHNGWQVDQAILSEEDRVIVFRFGHDWDPTCMKMDETLFGIAEKIRNFAQVYLVDITEVRAKTKRTIIINCIYTGGSVTDLTSRQLLNSAKKQKEMYVVIMIISYNVFI